MAKGKPKSKYAAKVATRMPMKGEKGEKHPKGHEMREKGKKSCR